MLTEAPHSLRTLHICRGLHLVIKRSNRFILSLRMNIVTPDINSHLHLVKLFPHVVLLLRVELYLGRQVLHLIA
jgi:hypothetical protein